MFQLSDTFFVSPGSYYKKSDPDTSTRQRVGFAHLSCDDFGILRYTNRRGETVVVNGAFFVKKSAEGYTHLNARTATDHASVEEINAALQLSDVTPAATDSDFLIDLAATALAEDITLRGDKLDAAMEDILANSTPAS